MRGITVTIIYVMAGLIFMAGLLYPIRVRKITQSLSSPNRERKHETLRGFLNIFAIFTPVSLALMILVLERSQEMTWLSLFGLAGFLSYTIGALLALYSLTVSSLTSLQSKIGRFYILFNLLTAGTAFSLVFLGEALTRH